MICSFCSKHRQEVAVLIAGPGVLICNECISVCFVEMSKVMLRKTEPEKACGITRADRLDSRVGELQAENTELRLEIEHLLAERNE